MISYIICFAFLLSTTYGAPKKPMFTAGIVEDIVKSEVQRKMPSNGKHHKSMKGFHLKEATDAINKLVDESIVDRVQEAEKEVSRMLLKSIEHHIQDAGKVLLQQDENVCRDKLDSCDKLADSGVCETSKDAMILNCPETCHFCGMLKELKQEKVKNEQQEQLEQEELEKPKKKKKHHHKHHHHHKQEFQQTSKLGPEETQLLHQNMLDQTIDHANLPSATDNSPEPAQTSDTSEPEPETTTHEGSDAREYDNNNKNGEQEAEAEHQKEEEEEERQRQEEEEKKREEERRRQARLRKKRKKAAKLHANLMAQKEDYFSTHCHPLCAKECIESCAPGCCDHRIPNLKEHHLNTRRCHPMCKKICLPSCGVGCCAAGIKPVPQPQAGMCPPGCPVACAPHCLDSCCFPSAPVPQSASSINMFPVCYGSCVNSCESSCPAICCPSHMESLPPQCPSPCSAKCAPACTPDCCVGQIPLPELPLSAQRPFHKKPHVSVPTLPMPGPLPEAFDNCPGTCPSSCAPGCDFDCCRPYLDPSIVSQMLPPENAAVAPSETSAAASQPETAAVASPESAAVASPPAPPMSSVIHVQHVLTPEQSVAAAPAVSETPATCPAECQQHCGPACARDGCCTDKKKKRSHIPKSHKQHHQERTFELEEFDDGMPVFYIDQQ